MLASITSKIIQKLNIKKNLYGNQDDLPKGKVAKKDVQDALQEVYKRGDKVMTVFIGLHLVVALIIALIFQNIWAETLTAGLTAVGLFGLSVTFRPRKFFTRVIAGICLQMFAFLLFYQLQVQGQKIDEGRFFFFIAFTIMIVYQDWRAIWPGAIFLFGVITLPIVLSYVELFTGANIGSFLDFVMETEFVKATRELFFATEGKQQVILYDRLIAYFGILSIQVVLCSSWAYFMQIQTIKEMLSKRSLIAQQKQIAQANEELENNVKNKTEDLQRALETSQTTEEELRQNMEELQATQDEMNVQSRKIRDSQEAMKKVEQELRQRQQDMERTQWLESNLSKFDDLMRLNYDKSLEEFTDVVLLNLADLLNGSQAALYVYDEDKDRIEMKGGYACTPKTVKKSSFYIGEGVLGQIVKTKKTHYLEDLPIDSATVESALSKISNKSLIVVPLLYNEKIQGVLELASLSAMSELHRHFLERLGKNIASMLQNIRSMLRTQKLLKQSREMTDELQRNTAQIEQTQLEIERRAAEFQAQFNAINLSMLVVEYTEEGEITQVNKKFLKLSKYTKDELVGQHHSSLLPVKVAESEDYKQFWRKVHEEAYHETEHKLVTKDGATFWLRANYYCLATEQKKKPSTKPIYASGTKQLPTTSPQSEGTPTTTTHSAPPSVVRDVSGAHSMSQTIMMIGWDISLQKLQEQQIKQNLEELQTRELESQQSIKQMQKLQDELETRAKEYQGQLQAINLSIAMINMDRDGVILSMNDKFAEIFNYAKNDLVGQHHEVLVRDGYAKSKPYRKLWQQLYKNEFVEGEFKGITRDEKVVWLRGSYYPITDARNNLSKILVLAYDITKEREQAAQIKQNIADLEKVREELEIKTNEMSAQLEVVNLIAGVVELAPTGEILSVNELFLEFAKYDGVEELAGQHHQVLVDAGFAQTKAYKKLWETLGKGEHIEGIYEYLAKDKSKIKLQGSFFPVKNQEGKVFKILHLTLDITTDSKQRIGAGE
ncbi:PAS domain-containing protein [Microscilla marina]|uniref:PAS domain S-box protein n=1 Tax=Microscilla marina ATCC 23134 TaxID=313606 RepID=A1ZHN2_MICM2|nr:PAS domain-containing protein [Microscilla marina]EAY30039.1 PAS domain S-box protein [Microscilla marina ATCC 23134]